MTGRADYTSEEWKLLKDTPYVVGAAVAAAAKSGLGTTKELVAVVTGTTSGIVHFPQNELIQALIKEEDKPSPFEDMKREELGPAALEKCRQVSALLERKVPDQEAADYRRWVIRAGEEVAKAAKEGGFLGIGGESVSEHERSLLEEIAAAVATQPAGASTNEFAPSTSPSTSSGRRSGHRA